MRHAIEWQVATLKTVRQETARVKTFTFTLPAWTPHRAGQHYDIRLTAPDGYQAQRSYSVASEPERKGEIDLTVELVEDGEVSTYLHEGLAPGDQLEMRGPIGGYFVWDVSQGGPLLLIGGGSGVVPLMAMLRHRAAARSTIPAQLLYSVRTPADVIYAGELDKLAQAGSNLEVLLTFTREKPPAWKGYARRIDQAMLAEVLAPVKSTPRVYICGPTLLVESAANSLLQARLPREIIRTERFGPTAAPLDRMETGDYGNRSEPVADVGRERYGRGVTGDFFDGNDRQPD
jgi:ferredoxin-NADP reductase